MQNILDIIYFYIYIIAKNTFSKRKYIRNLQHPAVEHSMRKYIPKILTSLRKRNKKDNKVAIVHSIDC